MRECWDCETPAEWADLDELGRCEACRANDPITTVSFTKVTEPELDW